MGSRAETRVEYSETFQPREERRRDEVRCPACDRGQEEKNEGAEDPATGDSFDVAAEALFQGPGAQANGRWQENEAGLRETLARVQAGAEGSSRSGGRQEEEGEDGGQVSAAVVAAGYYSRSACPGG